MGQGKTAKPCVGNFRVFFSVRQNGRSVAAEYILYIARPCNQNKG